MDFSHHRYDTIRTDFDIAVSLEPQRVMDALTHSGIQVIPTGLKHGTVTAVLDQHPIEITTLRQDVATDGRHAKVRYTESFQLDASRRDFTMNALFLDKAGNLYDFFQGVEDLRAGVVRFIGDPAKRVAEDHLRILRFFRFQAYYGSREATFHPESLQACLNAKETLLHLSKERVTKEWLKLLEAPCPFPILRVLLKQGIADLVQGLSPDAHPVILKKLEGLSRLEKGLGKQAIGLVRLFLFSNGGRALAHLRLSNRQLYPLNVWQTHRLPLTQKSLRTSLYHLGHPCLIEGLLWLESIDHLMKDPTCFETLQAQFQMLQAYLKGLEKPVFPLRGQDILDAGIPPGPAITMWLKSIKTWWIEADFEPNRQACLAYFKEKKAQPQEPCDK